MSGDPTGAGATGPPLRIDRVDACVEEILRRAGRRLVVGTPLGIGKPNQLVNGLYRRAVEDPRIELELITALSLSRPKPSGELERRLLGPLVERLFGDDYPDLEFVLDRRAGRLPANVTVHEFYLEPGRELDVASTQQSYISTNYTDVLRDLEAHGVNVLMQLVAGPETVDGRRCYSLSSNPDLGLDLLDREAHRRRQGRGRLMVVGQVNRHLPFMAGPAAVPAERFDVVLEAERLDFLPFAPPPEPVSTVDASIALCASTLIRDGGSLQLGIGALGDAIAGLLCERHRENERYRRLVSATGLLERSGPLIEAWGGLGRFEQGLYAPTEMLVSGFLHLYRAGVLARRAYPDAALQRVLDARGDTWPEAVSLDLVRALVAAGALARRPDAGELARWQRLGVLAADLALDGGRLRSPRGLDVAADLADEETLRALGEVGLGAGLRGGRLAHAGFFLGPRDFYEALRTMDPAERALFEMTRISFVNQLTGIRPGGSQPGDGVPGDGEEELKRSQRRHARFLNTGLIVTLGGAVASDGLEDGRVLSGVGGQYNFVAMANELEDGRSLLMIRSTRADGGGRISSNVRFNYGHTTIPRALRDIVITEYGIADLRGRDDRAVALSLLAIADSRFQDRLLSEAKRAGKVRAGDRIADRDRRNLPARLEDEMRPFRREGMLPRFPFGTPLTDDEVALAGALRGLRSRTTGRIPRPPSVRALRQMIRPPAAAAPYLERMALDRPAGWRERALRAVVVWALTEAGSI
ncbi:MAG TPA: acetyl-CoA hydrolase/transferase C-terminal domain-containing protein [Thermoanaerobaculia bacterium]|nr:acetyl-CoA hydrolase/transferase C-terminal domain-containing protein [Thermoanaerobaculia bacterium]